jgi:hypothetical protein
MDLDQLICLLRSYREQTGARIDLRIDGAPLREMQAVSEPNRYLCGALVRESIGICEDGFNVSVSSPFRPATDEDIDAEVARLRATHARAA